MRIHDAANRALQELRVPTHLRDLVAYIEYHGYFTFTAEYPERALGVALDRRSRGLATSQASLTPLFYRAAPATYGLVEWLNAAERDDITLDQEILLSSSEQPATTVPPRYPPGISRFDYASVNKALPVPGIYAWYAKIDVGFADYRRDLTADRVDLGERNLRELLLRHSQKFSPPPYAATAKSTFEMSWEGTLHPQLALSIDRILNERNIEAISDEKDRAAAKLVQIPFRHEKTRRVLVDILLQASPIFSAPIYIGTTDNLKRRLSEHVGEISQMRAIITARPEEREKLLAAIRAGKLTNFASRATALDLGPNQLEVYTLEVEQLARGDSLTTRELESLAACAEWLLNRWHRPLAGRI